MTFRGVFKPLSVQLSLSPGCGCERGLPSAPRRLNWLYLMLLWSKYQELLSKGWPLSCYRGDVTWPWVEEGQGRITFVMFRASDRSMYCLLFVLSVTATEKTPLFASKAAGCASTRHDVCPYDGLCGVRLTWRSSGMLEGLKASQPARWRFLRLCTTIESKPRRWWMQRSLERGAGEGGYWLYVIHICNFVLQYVT